MSRALIAGASPFFDNDVDNTAQALKTSAGVISTVTIENPSNADAFLQLFDAATGDVTVGTTTPDYVIGGIPTGTHDHFVFPESMNFNTAITYSGTTTATGSTDPSTGLVVSFAFK